MPRGRPWSARHRRPPRPCPGAAPAPARSGRVSSKALRMRTASARGGAARPAPCGVESRLALHRRSLLARRAIEDLVEQPQHRLPGAVVSLGVVSQAIDALLLDAGHREAVGGATEV